MRRMLRRPKPSPPYPEWVRPEFARRVDLIDIIRQSELQPNVKGFTRRQRYQLVFMYMHMRGVVWSERSHAHFGLGFADPWSDRRIASFVLAVPQQVLNRPREVNKRLARLAMRGIMPEEVRQAARKIEPMPLFDRGFKERGKHTALDLLTHSRADANGYMNERAVLNHYKSFLRGEPQRHDFWWALTLEMWLRQYWP